MSSEAPDDSCPSPWVFVEEILKLPFRTRSVVEVQRFAAEFVRDELASCDRIDLRCFFTTSIGAAGPSYTDHVAVVSPVLLDDDAVVLDRFELSKAVVTVVVPAICGIVRKCVTVSAFGHNPLLSCRRV